MSQHGTESDDDEIYRMLFRDIRLLPVLLASVIGTLGTNVISPALPAIAESLMVSDSRIGLLVSVYSLMAMVFVPITGVLADIYGRRTVLLPSLFVFGLSGTAITFVGTFNAILVLRAIQGLSYAAIMPLSVTLLGDLYDGATGSAAQGLRVGANGISTVLTPAIAGVLAGIAWNFPFLIHLICFPALVLTYLYLPETASNGAEDRGIRETVRRYAGAIRAEVTEINLGVLMFGEFVRDVVRYALITFIPLFAVRVLGTSFAQAGAILSVRGLVIIVIGPMSGAIVAKFSRKQALVGSLLIVAACVALVPLSPTPLALAGLVGAYTVGDALFSPVIKDTVTGLASDERRGGIVSGLNMLKYGGQTASPAVFGVVLAVWGFDALFPLAAVIAVVYAGLLLVVLSTDI